MAGESQKSLFLAFSVQLELELLSQLLLALPQRWRVIITIKMTLQPCKFSEAEAVVLR